MYMYKAVNSWKKSQSICFDHLDQCALGWVVTCDASCQNADPQYVGNMDAIPPGQVIDLFHLQALNLLDRKTSSSQEPTFKTSPAVALPIFIFHIRDWTSTFAEKNGVVFSSALWENSRYLMRMIPDRCLALTLREGKVFQICLSDQFNFEIDQNIQISYPRWHKAEVREGCRKKNRKNCAL